jgi:bacterioferritin (cytochrome b1)
MYPITTEEKSLARSLTDQVLSLDGSPMPSKEIHEKVNDLFENLFCRNTDENILANAQLDEEEHIRTLQTRRGINFRE